jgi:tetratricopeptide (TPR) repeat protein
MTLTEMPRRTRRTQQHRAREAPAGEALAKSFYDLAQFHESNGRLAEAVSNYAAALQMNLDPALRPYCRTYLADNLCKTQRFDEARRRAALALAETDDPELTRFLTRLLDTIERGLGSR